MPVRGTTAWGHAIIQKKVINLDHGGAKHVMCSWDTCEKDGYENNKVVVRDNAPGYEPKTITYIFCTERHKQYWLNSIRNVNNLPPGFKRSIL